MRNKQSVKKLWRDTLPPYGVMPTLASPSSDPPPHWRGTPAAFTKWLEDQLQLIAKLLWPRCNEADKSWEGFAAKRMIELTEADLRLLRDLRAPHPDRPIDLPPDVAGRHTACPPQQAFFEIEDFSSLKPPFEPSEAFTMYQPKANEELIAARASPVIGAQMKAKLPLGMIYFFKKELQRPRPYQAALLLLSKEDQFNHEGAKSALHPAMISGHCLQGMVFLMAFAERMILNRPSSVIQPDWTALARYYTDFGDRRVLAGVHYPSDNLSSWIVALNLCTHVVHPDAAAETEALVSQAISNSFLYGAISKQAVAGSPYRPAWDQLQKLLKPPPKEEAAPV